ncbi:ATP-grasp domain-containing protein [Mycoplasmatota bacterium]|nr:ATP-grasp domain-containing protein [Mycoplasmatota bacterium]
MNILITSVGTRNKIVQYFKKELNGKGLVIATDASELAPALYEADKHYIVPRIDDLNYLKYIKKICRENNIKGILSLIDPELSIISKHKKELIDMGVMPIVSDYETIELCFDKYKFNKKLFELGFNTIKSYINKEEFYKDLNKGIINYPVFVKPIKGSASINISKVYADNEIELLFNRYDNLMIQEYINGNEFGIDVYIDMISNQVTSLFIKEKLKMRAGETDKSVSVHNDNLKNIILELVEKIRFKGIIDIDAFEMNGKYYISEINPRFGGGYPHAYECGINVVSNIVKNIENQANVEECKEYIDQVYMMKYNELKLYWKKSD